MSTLCGQTKKSLYLGNIYIYINTDIVNSKLKKKKKKVGAGA